MYDSTHKKILVEAMAQVGTNMKSMAPIMAEQMLAWFRQLSGGHEAANYFKHPRAYPFLLFPWWLEKYLNPEVDIEFQTDLAYSSVNAYYYIRLFDNLMDGDITQEVQLLPGTVFFFHELHRVYQKQFDYAHPFWHFFIRTWLHMSETTMQDALLMDIDEATFTQIVSAKVCAAKIPVAAVCYKYHQPELIEPWSQFIDLFGRWHQMQEDLFDWQEDSQNGISTYFLSQAQAQKCTDELLSAWVIREGIDWGFDTLTGWMKEMQEIAGKLNNPDLIAYLIERQNTFLAQREKMTKGLVLLQTILGKF